MLVCAFYKLEVSLIHSCHAAEIFEKFVYLVLGLIKPIVKNNCSLTSYLVIGSLNPSSFRVGLHFPRHI
jgi:hypothetical protein